MMWRMDQERERGGCYTSLLMALAMLDTGFQGVVGRADLPAALTPRSKLPRCFRSSGCRSRQCTEDEGKVRGDEGVDGNRDGDGDGDEGGRD